MLEYLDTLIAFVVIMAVVSLMITIFTQMVSAFLGLRGTNLKKELEELLKSVRPDLGEQAASLARKVLSHPLISDSAMADSWIGRRLAGPLAERWRLASAIRMDELARALETIATDTSGRYQDVQDAAKKIFSKPAEKAEAAINDLKAWFNSAMDRASQRFALRMRVWTVAFSVVVAFGIQLDSVWLLNQLSTDVELRARLVASADAVTNQAEQILGSTGSAVPSVYAAAVNELREKSPEAKNLSEPPEFASREDAEAWLRAQLGGASSAEAVIGQYRDIVQSNLSTAIDRLKDQAGSLRAEVGRSGIRLIPDPYPGLWAFLWSMCPMNRQFWGILMSAGLLSLGAPFWFNALKTLATLRPILATKEKQEQSRPS